MYTDKDRVGIITFYHHKIMTETIKLIKQDKKKKPKATINAFNDNGDDLTLQVSLLSSYFIRSDVLYIFLATLIFQMIKWHILNLSRVYMVQLGNLVYRTIKWFLGPTTMAAKSGSGIT